MKKVLIVATVGCFLGFEVNDISILKKIGYEVHCASNFKFEGETEKTKDVQMIRHQIDFSRSPYSMRTIVAYKQLKKLLKQEKFDLIHCHTPVGGILTRLAAKKYRKKGTKVLYTAHGFHFFKGAPIKNWLLYYPIEWICSWLTDVLITINTEDYERAKKHFHPEQVRYVPGVGVDTQKYSRVEISRVEKRDELGLEEHEIMLFSAGELNKNKNHSVVIEAISKINNPKIKYFIAGEGALKDYYEQLIKKYGLEERIKLLGYRKDIPQLLAASDAYLLPSIREGLNVSLMEAMSNGCPCICSDIRGNVDLIQEAKGGYRVKADSVSSWKNAIEQICMSEEERKKMGIVNCNHIMFFSKENVQKEMLCIYEGKMS